MSTMRSAVGSSAPPITIQHEGQTYRLRMLDFVMLTELGDWMLERENNTRVKSDRALINAGLLTVEQVIARKDEFVQSAIMSGRYSLGSPRMMQLFGALEKASKDTNGEPVAGEDTDSKAAERIKGLGEAFEPTMKLFSLMLGCDVDAVVNLLDAKGVELVDKINLVLKQSVSDPKAQPAPVNGQPAPATAST